MEPPPPIAVLRGHQASITSVCFSDDNVLSCSSGCELYRWDLKSRRITQTLHKFEENDDGLLRVCTNDTKIISNSRLGRIFVYDKGTGDVVNEIETGISAGFAGCRVDGDDVWFPDAFSSRLCILDLRDGSHFPAGECGKHGMVMDISIKGNHIGVAMEDSTVLMIDNRNVGAPEWINELKHTDPIISVAVIDDTKCVVGSSQKNVYEVEANQSNVFYEMPHAGIDDISIRPDGKLWATAGWDGRVRIFEAKKKKALAVLKHHRGGIHTVCYSNDGLLASGGDDRGIALWSLYRK